MATLLIRRFIPLLALLACPAALARDDYEIQRQHMVQEIVAMTTDTRFETGRSALDERLLAVMRKVERHKFVPASEVVNAYQNRPLPIGYGQTISQPYIVAIMTELMRVEKNHTVLEIGTGSGYQAAILAELAKAVYTIEIIEPLGKQAQERLQNLGYSNAQTKVGDGYYGWEQYAPYDSIIVTAAASHIPPPLIKQLKPGGRMVIPVGAQFLTQYLMLVEKNPDGTISSKQILPVSFVPLTGGH
ncbi:MAG TPA: protein-L-isoaspartate(D-aspartate) O-methyltransferase [Burkholderiales bacterium]|nr:protein-L-isoaspartate(D-aspartate) O-methyltransferase [Burkholderiales bacterium]